MFDDSMARADGEIAQLGWERPEKRRCGYRFLGGARTVPETRSAGANPGLENLKNETDMTSLVLSHLLQASEFRLQTSR
jgi:hypothetical protein